MSAVAAYGALGGSEAAPRRRGRFTSSLTVPELLEAVARVAQAAAKNGQDPANLTKRIWDTARVLSGEDLPQAETIRQRLRLSWEAVLTCALLPPEDRGIYLRNRDDPDWGINFGELTPRVPEPDPSGCRIAAPCWQLPERLGLRPDHRRLGSRGPGKSPRRAEPPSQECWHLGEVRG